MGPLSLITLLTAFPLAVLSAPAPAPASLQRREISQDLYDELSLFEQFTAASYCGQNTDTPRGGGLVNCGRTGVCPSVERAGTVTLMEFRDTTLTDTTGYLSLTKSLSLLTLTFRGTASLKSFLTDALFASRPAPQICANCTVFTGFLLSWSEIRDPLLPLITSQLASNPNLRLVVTGHSLGAGIATVAAADLRSRGLEADLYTYGGSRVGNGAFASFMMGGGGAGGQNFRVAHVNDTVPRLPPKALGYEHFWPEYYISAGQGVRVTAGDVEVCQGDEREVCGSAGNNGMDIRAHLWYFNSIAACFINLFPSSF